MKTITNLDVKTYNQFYKKYVKVFTDYLPKNHLSPEMGVELLANPQLRALMEMFPGIFCVADFQASNYLYVSENVRSILGYTPEDFYQQGVQKTFTLFSESQVDTILNKVLPLFFEILEKHSKLGDVKDIRISYNTFLKRKDGTYGNLYIR
jgi:hypothetical protein